MKEIWRDITGYEGRYQISNFGQVKTLPRKGMLRERIMRVFHEKNNYQFVSLTVKQKSKTHYIHRLMAKAFIPNPENKPCINHINNNPSDNRLDNLEWVTHKENTHHSVIQGRRNTAHGEKCGSSKLKEKTVRLIRYLYEKKGFTQRGIVAQLKADGVFISQPNIGYITRYESWAL